MFCQAALQALTTLANYITYTCLKYVHQAADENSPSKISGGEPLAAYGMNALFVKDTDEKLTPSEITILDHNALAHPTWSTLQVILATEC